MASSSIDAAKRQLANHRKSDLLRFLTCGSVDDGKSTLIGRLLHDTESVFDDQLESAVKDSAKFGTTGEELDFALLVDGLEAEREQGITIDVAYRYFSTPKRRFIIADTPGHVQYTRNMATGASTADLAVILVDARQGMLPQTCRHAFIASLLGIKHLIIAINKMDLVEFSEDVFEKIRIQLRDFTARLDIGDVAFVPVSAKAGDNVVKRSENMPWYGGGTFLDHLETVHIASDRNLIDLRFPIQLVSRPTSDFRGFAGTLASGVLKKGDEIVALPSGKTSRVKAIVTFDGEKERAVAGDAITVTLEDEIDLSRGDMMVKPNNAPTLGHTIEAMVVWMVEAPLEVGNRYELVQTGVKTQATILGVRYRTNPETLHRENADKFQLNEIGRVKIETMRPLAYDAYADNRTTGAFILVDRLTNATVAAGMIVDRSSADDALARRRPSVDARSNLRAQKGHVSRDDREKAMGQKGCTIWLTGLPRSGKTSLAFELESRLFKRGRQVYVLDGELLRTGVNCDLGFSPEDRWENQRRTAEMAKVCNEQGQISVVSLVSPLAADRDQVRRIVGEDRFLEVYCDAPLEVCEERDTAELYARARRGEIDNVTGVDAPYEAPEKPELVLPTATDSVEVNVDRIIAMLEERGFILS